MRVLVVDDDTAVRDSIVRTLRFDGYAVETAADGHEAIAMVRDAAPDAVILDVSMPRMDGLEACRQLRMDGVLLPILMLTARTSVGDRVAGLDAGADDYLIKPFSVQELQARLRALLRRSVLNVAAVAAAPEPVDDGLLAYADLRMDPATREVWRGDRQIRLTRTEFAILEILLRHPRQVMTRALLYERIWGYDFGETSNSVQVYMGYLRRKLEAEGEKRLLHTARGVGFVLREEPL